MNLVTARNGASPWHVPRVRHTSNENFSQALKLIETADRFLSARGEFLRSKRSHKYGQAMFLPSRMTTHNLLPTMSRLTDEIGRAIAEWGFVEVAGARIRAGWPTPAKTGDASIAERIERWANSNGWTYRHDPQRDVYVLHPKPLNRLIPDTPFR